MNNKIHFLKTNAAGLAVGAALLAALAQSADNAGAQSIGVTVNPPVVVAPPVVMAPPVVIAPAVVTQDDYVYYPNYAIYYNSYRHQYAYLNGDAWVMAAAPVGVSVDVLLASPSVHMDFHDSPARHHAEMMQKYPQNWKPVDGRQEHQDRQDQRKN